MSTIASRLERRAATTASLGGIRIATWTAVVGSRLLALGAGAVGALSGPEAGFRQFDPSGISVSLGRVGNALAASTDRWDAIHYLAIAQHGYTNAISTAYFPLYPLLIRTVGWLTGSDVVAGVLISVFAFAVALILLNRLVREELDERVANATILLLAFAPLSFFFTAIYTESLFLALSVGTFYLARHDRPALASLTAVAATLTHIEGILLLIPLAFCLWERRGRTLRIRRLVRWDVLLLAPPMLALVGLMAYLHAKGFGWLAPVTNQTNGAWHHQFTGPVIGVIRAVDAGVSGLWRTLHGVPPVSRLSPYALTMPFQGFVYLVVLTICIASLFQVWQRLPKVYAIYSALFLITITSSPIQGDPLHSFDRYVLPLFPLWVGAAAWLQQRRLLKPAIELSAVLLLFYTFQFGRWTFVA
jgi:hypothetical protein